MANNFFEERSDQSAAKARIVSKYFAAWTDVILSKVYKQGGRIAYVDLFAGPGRYKDGTISTPLMIRDSILKNEKRRQTVLMYFNDQNPDHVNNLKIEINKIPGIATLKHEPIVTTSEINDCIDKHYEIIKDDPIFSFIDPFGYKGLSLKLLNKAIKNWGCDCVFFFNYSRINAGISNSCVKNHINALFGEERVNNLSQEIKNKKSELREEIILRELKEAIKEMSGEYILSFKFRRKSGKSTSHYIIFISKHVLGYNIMKGIMANESSSNKDGVASFEHSQSPKFIFSEDLDSLIEELPLRFAGETISMIDIYNKHNVDTPFIAKNYKDALKTLEKNGRITVESPPGKRRRENTFADNLLVIFPP